MKRLFVRAFLSTIAGVFTLATAHATEPEAVPGEYVVKLKPTLNAQTTDRDHVGSLLGSYVKSTIPGQNIVVVKRPVFEIRSNVIQTLSENPYVDVVEPNFIYRINRTPNDPELGRLWGLKNAGVSGGVAGVDIGAEEAWDIQTGSKNIIVAVIDTGVLWNQSDLKENIWVNEAEKNGAPGVDDDQNGFVDDIHGYDFANNDGDPMDDHGHGSHCSGTIGAKGNDGMGIVGVNWDVRIMGIKFLDAGGSGSLENALKSIDYATKMGAHISNNSWGGGAFSQTLKEAIERANNAGSLFVAAAGNESNNNDSRPTYPNSYEVPNILSVAAINNNGTVASFSNYGRAKVHVGAPGVNILSTTTAGYESWSGTSMAAPHVSGIAALLLANEPNLKHLDLKERIITTAEPIAGLRGKVKTGLAHAYNALTNKLPQPDPNDPANWTSVQYSLQTDHPYANKAKLTWTVNVPGATQISIHFDRFETEANYDVLTIKDSTGKVIEQLSGTNNDIYTQPITGESATLEFVADDTINYHGFEVNKVAYKN